MVGVMYLSICYMICYVMVVRDGVCNHHSC